MNYYDMESERCIIAAMLDSEESLIESCATMQTDDFYEPRHQAMFSILNNLFIKSTKPTYLEMLKEGVKQGSLPTPEDREYAKQTIGYHVSSVNLPFWFKNVKDKSKLRKLRHSLMVLAEQIKDPGIDVDELVQNATRNISELTTETTEKIDTGADLVKVGKETIEERMNHKGELQGITTGIGKLNRLTSGWKGGDLILLSAESGVGKTAFAQSFIACGCFFQSNGTLYINSEMSRQQVIMRFASMLSGIEADKLKFGEITISEKNLIFESMEEIEKSPFFHYPSPSLNINKAASMIRKLQVQKGIKLVILDYIGRMDRVNKDMKEWEELHLICKTLKTIAQELNLAIIVLAQLNDDGALQAAKRMRNEADIMLKIQPMSNEEQADAQTKGYKITPNYWIYLDKNRDGQGGVMIPVKFDKQRMQVIDVSNT